MKKTAFLLIFALSGNVQGADEWRKGDIYRQAAFIGLNAIDYSQTSYVRKHCDVYMEKNPLLGECPTQGEINRFFATSVLLNTAIVHFLPKKYRAPFQYISIGISAYHVGSNFRLNVKMEF